MDYKCQAIRCPLFGDKLARTAEEWITYKEVNVKELNQTNFSAEKSFVRTVREQNWMGKQSTQHPRSKPDARKF